MSRNDTIELLNDTLDTEQSIDAVLRAHEDTPDYLEESGWVPGDPLFPRPRGFWHGQQHIRPMFEIMENGVFNVPRQEKLSRLYYRDRCAKCKVDWEGSDACWMCGEHDTPRTVAKEPRNLFGGLRGRLFIGDQEISGVQVDPETFSLSGADFDGDTLLNSGAHRIQWVDDMVQYSIVDVNTVRNFFGLDPATPRAAPDVEDESGERWWRGPQLQRAWVDEVASWRPRSPSPLETVRNQRRTNRKRKKKVYALEQTDRSYPTSSLVTAEKRRRRV